MILTGTNITSPILPGDTGDRFPSHIDIYGKGGYRSVTGFAGLYDIPENRKSLGMLVYTQDSGKFWTLGSGQQNWIELPFTAYTSKINGDNILYNVGDQDISGTKNFHGYNTINFLGVLRFSDPGGIPYYIGQGTTMSTGLFSKMSAVDKGFQIIRKYKKLGKMKSGVDELSEDEQNRFKGNLRSGKSQLPGLGPGELYNILRITSGKKFTYIYISGDPDIDGDFPQTEKDEDDDDIQGGAGGGGGGAGGGGAGGTTEEEDPGFDDSMEEDKEEEDEDFGFPEEGTGYYRQSWGRSWRRWW